MCLLVKAEMDHNHLEIERKPRVQKKGMRETEGSLRNCALNSDSMPQVGSSKALTK